MVRLPRVMLTGIPIPVVQVMTLISVIDHDGFGSVEKQLLVSSMMRNWLNAEQVGLNALKLSPVILSFAPCGTLSSFVGSSITPS